MKLDSIRHTIYRDNLARNIWKKRKEMRYTQEKLAAKTGISAQYIFLLENSRVSNPGIFTIMVLADFFGCTINDMLADTREEVAS